MNDDAPCIVIIGAGASGTLTAIQFLSHLKVKSTIILIDKAERTFFRGVAYSSQLEYEPLNVHTGKMSAWTHRPDDFYEWLIGNRDASIKRDSFVSRRWYGDYLEYTFCKQAELSKHITVKKIVGEVVSIEKHTNTEDYTLFLESGKKIAANAIFLATGNEAPQSFFTAPQIKMLGSAFHADPWGARPQHIHVDDTVLVLGTGLTMVDTVLSLRERHHRGPIYCFSRNGYLPLPHAADSKLTAQLPKKNISLKDCLFYLRQQTAEAKVNQLPWQSVLDAFRPFTASVWKGFSVAEKAFYLKKLRTLWDIHRHRIPPKSDQLLQELFAKGQLKIVNGRFTDIQKADNHFDFYFNEKKTGKSMMLSVHHIINCTGPSSDYHQCNNKLMHQMLLNGYSVQDELKLGIITGEQGEIINAQHLPLSGCYAVGPLRKACEWESTAIREIRMQAEEVASILTGQLSKTTAKAIVV